MIPGPLTGHPNWLGWDFTTVLLACPLSDWHGCPLRCRWCNAALTGRRTAWCSSSCSYEAGSQHYWSDASARAKREQGRCQRCGHSGTPPPDARALAAWLLAVCRPPMYPPRGSDQHGEAWATWRYLMRQRHRVPVLVKTWERRYSLETNHRRPVRGHHNAAGCHHHQANLEVLCVRCHRAETASQRARGLLEPHTLDDHTRSLWSPAMYEFGARS